ncbi:hypothetical protein F5146DRAFT_1134784 [Armillaria mellea]|nr:hypothetical protein F5146DRAFT_1134784 [Armillaria mellea]
MNNLAACALKENRFSVVKQHTTNGLTIGYLTNPVKRAKALYRRAKARCHLGNLNKEGLEGINLALELQPGETAILALKDELTRLLGTVVSAAGLKRYLDQQPQPSDKISWSQGLNTAGQLIEEWRYDKLSKDSPLRGSLPPMY